MTEFSSVEQLELGLSTAEKALLTPEEIYRRCDERLLREFAKEDRRLEYKSAGTHGKELAEYFSMWANTPPGGLLVVGVANDTNFEGCSKLTEEQRNRVEGVGNEHCPEASYDSKRVPIRRDNDGQQDYVIVFLIRYHATRIIRTDSTKAYVRHADRIRQLKTPEEIRNLQEQKGEVAFETEDCKLNYPDGFDADAMRAFAKTVIDTNRWPPERTVEQVLTLRHLGRMDGTRFIPNVACALLFARDPMATIPGARVRFQRFDGDEISVGERWNAVKDQFFEGPIPHQIAGAAEVLRSNLRVFSRLGKKGQFDTTPEYPEFAWYEAIVNAVAHRSYGDGMKNRHITIRMFDNRLEVESPGPFPPLVTAENLEHHPRNPHLMDALRFIGYALMAGEGVPRMRNEMKALDLPEPEFVQADESHSLVRVTLRNNVKQRKAWVDADVATLLGETIVADLSPDEKRCINYIKEYDSITVTHAARITDRDWGTVNRMLRKLADRGILERQARKNITRDSQARFILGERYRNAKVEAGR